MIKGFLTLLIFQWLGELVTLATGAPIPGPVFGMLLLLLALLVRQKASQSLQESSHTLIQYLSLLFLPAGVGIFFLSDAIQAQWLAIAGAMILGTFISMYFSAVLAKKLLGEQ